MQKNIFTLTRFRALPAEIHLMLIGTLLTRGTYFMIWPFLAVILYRQFHFSAIAIGALLSISVIFGVVSGVYTGWLSDRFWAQAPYFLWYYIECVGFFSIRL
ncbi:hypothetical protein [Xenorhabdus bovienii]|uniref:MFS transporter n=1 Tax=Xenorhabdus bovienii str. kraussei Becker Underwood TaxID=1398204 RepID=A0A077Q1H8_XENBV|nr:hypothetical protein [Xenorhabdus bovienii]CDH25849.1 membrane hypothetical protein [Xenorhabdus bovienii str. kraussei Becker Underwood]